MFLFLIRLSTFLCYKTISFYQNTKTKKTQKQTSLTIQHALVNALCVHLFRCAAHARGQTTSITPKRPSRVVSEQPPFTRTGGHFGHLLPFEIRRQGAKGRFPVQAVRTTLRSEKKRFRVVLNTILRLTLAQHARCFVLFYFVLFLALTK